MLSTAVLTIRRSGADGSVGERGFPEGDLQDEAGVHRVAGDGGRFGEALDGAVGAVDEMLPPVGARDRQRSDRCVPGPPTGVIVAGFSS